MDEPTLDNPEQAHDCIVRPGTTICIDPGDRFCGMALFDEDAECYATLLYEHEHSILYGNLVHWLKAHLLERVVVEDFFLYPDKMQQQGYSQMRTPRAIGVIEWICELAGFTKDNGGYVEQGASIKKATRAIMNARGVKHVGKVVHEKDAELHGYYYFHNQKG